MATLVEDPVYGLWPIGLKMQGLEQVRRYCENLLGVFVPRTRGHELIDELARIGA